MATATAPAVSFQGISVPPESVNPAQFFALTRRKRQAEVSRSFAGLGSTDQVPLLHADLLGKIRVRFSGSLVITGTTVEPTYQWPYNLVKAARFTAGGQTNLFNVSGLGLRALEFSAGTITDRGVTQAVGAGNVTNGTLSKSSESWGVAPNKTAAAGTYNVELEWTLPICEDDRDLAGVIFAQSETQDLVLSIDWNTPGALFTGTDGSDTAVLTGTLIVEPTRYSIPVVNGHIVVPDLSLFHQVIEARQAQSIAVGTNEVILVGAGIGRSLQRVLFRTVSGTPSAPLAMSDSVYGPLGWRYGSNETPETFYGGTSMRNEVESITDCDLGAVWGYGLHDFNKINAFRDSVDEGQTSQLRLVVTIQSEVSLSSPAIEYIQETMLRA